MSADTLRTTEDKKEFFISYSDDDLTAYINSNEHGYEYDEENDFDGVHTYWDCWVCAAEDVRNDREFTKFSVLPGNLPRFKMSVSKNITIDELKVGDYARYAPVPGITTSTYAECLSVKFMENDGIYFVKWRKSNTEDKPFSAVYEANDNLNIVRPSF